jgi:hypothetical protein
VVVAELTAPGGLLVEPLDDFGLRDGNYRVELFAGSNTDPLLTSMLRLRSAR